MPNFKIVDDNPNEVSGGAGCLCAEGGCADTKGPFVVFYATEMESHIDPTPVLCAGCVFAAYNQLDPTRRTLPKPKPKAVDPADAPDV